jgi:hypothetical protein
MALTGENQIAQSKTCPSASLPTINLTLTVSEHNPVLHGQKPATSLLSDARPLLGYPSDVPKQSAYTQIQVYHFYSVYAVKCHFCTTRRRHHDSSGQQHHISI